MTIPEEVLAVLRNCEMTADSVTVTTKLDWDLFLAVYKVLIAAGGHWNPSTEEYIFAVDPRAALGVAVAKGAPALPVLQPSDELLAVMVALDAGETANLEPMLEALDAAGRLRKYIVWKRRAILARKDGRISAATDAEAVCDSIFKNLPPEWRW